MAQFGSARGLGDEISIKRKKEMDITLQKGITTELRCVLKFIELGYFCSIPYGDSAQYDVIVDIDGQLLKIQCKTASWCIDTSEPEVAFKIETRRSTTNTKKTTHYKYTKKDADFFYTYFKNEHYLIPVSEEGMASFRLRYEYPKTGQKQGIHLASDYTLDSVIRQFKEEVSL